MPKSRRPYNPNPYAERPWNYTSRARRFELWSRKEVAFNFMPPHSPLSNLYPLNALNLFQPDWLSIARNFLTSKLRQANTGMILQLRSWLLLLPSLYSEVLAEKLHPCDLCLDYKCKSKLNLQIETHYSWTNVLHVNECSGKSVDSTTLLRVYFF